MPTLVRRRSRIPSRSRVRQREPATPISSSSSSTPSRLMFDVRRFRIVKGRSTRCRTPKPPSPCVRRNRKRWHDVRERSTRRGRDSARRGHDDFRENARRRQEKQRSASPAPAPAPASDIHPMPLVPALTDGLPRQPATPPPVWVAVPHWDEVPTELQMFLLRSRHPELSYAERLLKCNYIPGLVTRKTDRCM